MACAQWLRCSRTFVSYYCFFAGGRLLFNTMPAKVQRKPASFVPIINPKRGKARMLSRQEPVKKRPSSVPYTRHGAKPPKVRTVKWAYNFFSILTLTALGLAQHMIDYGLVADLADTKCQECRYGTYALKSQKGREPHWRCDCWDCQHRMPLAKDNPIFTYGHGAVPLQKQMVALMCAWANIDQTKCELAFGLSKWVVEGIYKRWYQVASNYVIDVQGAMKLGTGRTWMDAEVDEVTIRKKLKKESEPTTQKKPVVQKKPAQMTWPCNFLGILVRGFPKQLVLEELPLRETDVRAPGPGPLTVEHWMPLSERWCAGRKLIVHSDSARAYKRKIRGCLHDSVVHKKRRVKVGGKWTWQKPIYTKTVKHKLPGSRTTVKVKAGTQYIDGFWRIMKAFIRPWRKSDAKMLRLLVRTAQLRYWNRGRDMYSVGAEVVKWHLKNK